MTVNVRVRDLENVEELKAQIERKVGFATDRFAVRLVEIHIAVSDMNGPRGGVDKHCSIRGVLEGGRAITLEERGADANRRREQGGEALEQLHWTNSRPSPARPHFCYEGIAIRCQGGVGLPAAEIT